MIAANSKRLFKNLGVENYINHKLCAYLTWDPYIDQTLKILSLCLRTPIFTKPNLCNLEFFFQYIFVYILPFPIKVHNMSKSHQICQKLKEMHVQKWKPEFWVPYLLLYKTEMIYLARNFHVLTCYLLIILESDEQWVYGNLKTGFSSFFVKMKCE